MATHLITGHAGTPHVSSSDQRHQNAILHGAGAYIVSGLACTMTNANTAHIAPGDMMLNGAYVRVTGNGEDVAVQSGSIGVTRIDYICARYEMNADTTESVTLVCKSGTGGAAPVIAEGDILNGATVAEFPLYSITLDGINPGTPVKLAQDFKGIGALGRRDSLTADDIPNISASKITSGTLPVSNGGTGATTASAARTSLGIGTIGTKSSLAASDIPNLAATKITSGTLDAARLPVKVLYSNASGNNGTVTLNETAANYKYVDIFFAENNGSLTTRCIQRVYEPNGKSTWLFLGYETSSVYQVSTVKYSISGTSMTRGTKKYMNAGSLEAGNDSNIAIYAVVGYK